MDETRKRDMNVVIVGDADCPNVETARERVALALARVGQPARWRSSTVRYESWSFQLAKRS